VRILFIGDIVGRVGRLALSERLGRLIDRHCVDLVVANAENAAAGFGLTADVADELFDLGIDVLTSGNHIWDKKEICEILEREERLLRPANYPGDAPGRGAGVYKTAGGVPVGILNLEGRVFMSNVDCPFRAADRLVQELKRKAAIILVDFHAEATSEKTALAWYLDGRVTAVVGTHTHVQTADERLLDVGTAFISDVGMTGSRDGIIGMRREQVIEKFLTQRPARFEVAKKDPMICAVLIEADEKSGRALTIQRIQEAVPL